MSHNKYHGIESTTNIESPLEAVHRIDRALMGIDDISASLQNCGIGCHESLDFFVNQIRSLCQDAEDGIMRESSDRLNDAHKATDNMLMAALAGCELVRSEGAK